MLFMIGGDLYRFLFIEHCYHYKCLNQNHLPLNLKNDDGLSMMSRDRCLTLLNKLKFCILFIYYFKVKK